jgi:hypothetical protein
MPTDAELASVKRQLQELQGEALLRDARAAGDHWASRYADWEGSETTVSKTVVIAVPNRARNKELVPYPIWSHWALRAVLLMERCFRGSTLYWPALGTYRDEDDKQHLDNPLIIESLAPVKILRESIAISHLIELCKNMVVSMDQDCILCVAGSMRSFIFNPIPKGSNTDCMNQFAYDNADKAYKVTPSDLKEEQYLVDWIAQRKEYFESDFSSGSERHDMRPHLHLYDRLIAEHANEKKAEFFEKMKSCYSSRNKWPNFLDPRFEDFNTRGSYADWSTQFRNQWLAHAARQAEGEG